MRLVFGVQYYGHNYHGWQIQPDRPTIQQSLENAFTKVADSKISVVGSGRTDTGVHASGQIAHFDTAVIRDLPVWVRGVNRFLPKDINVTNIIAVDENFHARFSAERRTYRFIIYNYPIRSSCYQHFSVQEFLPLNTQLMHDAAQFLVGVHDFTSVRDAACQSTSSLREVYKVSVFRRNNFVIFEITANAFLHHMVRNIMGLLVPIGQEKAPVRWLKDVLAAKNRALAGVTYSPGGLFLHKIVYPKYYNFQCLYQDHIIDLL